MYEAYVTTISNLRKHSNADRLMCATIFGNNVIVDLSYRDGQQVVYFPIDGQLNEDFAKANNLVRIKDENGKNIGGYLDPNKRNITALKLRGERSEGLVLPVECLSPYIDVNLLYTGFKFSSLNGIVICEKYIPKVNRSSTKSSSKNKKQKSTPYSPLFAEHIDTAQLAYNHNAFKEGDIIEVTLKMHGTSQRTGYLPVLKHYKRTIVDRILGRHGKPVYEYDYVSGTRRTVLENYDGGYYGSNSFREPHSKVFDGKLNKGETVYYEVVGFTDNRTPIMPSVDNKKTNDHEFIKQYGKKTVFSYGCTADGELQSDLYVYRMTLTNEDGFVIEYSPDQIRYRCEQIGVKAVPVLCRTIVNVPADDAGEYVTAVAEHYFDGADPIGKTHVREGVVVRILNRNSFVAFKHKNFSFKVLSGIATASISDDTALSDDMLSEV